jgi:hypothetical protein
MVRNRSGLLSIGALAVGVGVIGFSGNFAQAQNQKAHCGYRYTHPQAYTIWYHTKQFESDLNKYKKGWLGDTYLTDCIEGNAKFLIYNTKSVGIVIHGYASDFEKRRKAERR